ncbi:hypothetical protein BpHYR1_039565 [Brachionus plicatilis]|uniref:Uncharacterized protein n=1 Tax=Brachionus plicatilis TaxID=10195 RepID=A0A3M7QSL8_BRAPC|nr:hypothetical protein BpHYR1_039565 [Brachionus plicatilis]
MKNFCSICSISICRGRDQLGLACVCATLSWLILMHKITKCDCFTSNGISRNTFSLIPFLEYPFPSIRRCNSLGISNKLGIQIMSEKQKKLY